MKAASMIITGEGRFDDGSLEGKVTGGLATMTDGRLPLLIFCGSVDTYAQSNLRSRYDNLRFVDLSARVGAEAATNDVFGSIRAVLLEELRSTLTSRQRRVT